MAYRESRFHVHTLRDSPMPYFIMTVSHVKLVGELHHPIKSLFTVSNASFYMYSLAKFATILNFIDAQFNHFAINGTPVVLHSYTKGNWSFDGSVDWSLDRSSACVRACVRVCVRACERASERVSEWVSEWVSERAGERVSEYILRVMIEPYL